jgi:sarcosine oxidase
VRSCARFDAIVVGVGAMGSAALYRLARRGRRVLGLDRFRVPNAMGSSHGETRIIRLAYAEGGAYVPLLRRAYELWGELEAASGEQLLHTTGYVDIGQELVQGSLRSCEENGIDYELLTAHELAARYPAFEMSRDAPVLFQADGGFLLPERCIAAQAGWAQSLGAVVRTQEHVLDWAPTSSGVEVRTERGVYAADRLVLTPGAWAQGVARLPPGLVTAERQVLAWFEPLQPELFELGRFPVFGAAVQGGISYGFPSFGPGFKVGRYHHLGEVVDPEAFDRAPNDADEELLRTFVERYLPAGAGRLAAAVTCLFENSPDEDFIVDFHPESERVVVAAGFSGHGFKFASVVGEILADLVLDGGTEHEIGFLGLGRFS